MESLVQDLRYAARTLVRQPGFTLTAVLTLTLGIGATTAIFSVVNAVVLRPLPLEQSDRVVVVTNFYTARGVRGQAASAPDFYDWKEQSRSFEVLAYYQGSETSVTVGGTADYAMAVGITPGFLEALRAKAQLGRLFSAEEQRPGGPLAVLITDAFWRRRFDGSRSAIGTTLKARDTVFEIVGVLAPQFRHPARADVYYPAWLVPETPSRSGHNYRVVGRLRDGVTLEQANAEMIGIARRLEREYPQSNEGKSAVVVPLQDIIVGDSRGTLYMLLAAVCFVLFIACANVANLLLARATVRGREMVLRAALGAGRTRLVRQLLTESVLLAAAAAACGIVVARAGVAALVALAPPDLPRLGEIAVDGSALAFALAVSAVSSVLFGLTPALQGSSVRLVEGLRQHGKGTGGTTRAAWARNAFVVAQVALAVVLVVGGGLLGRSLVALATVDMGFSQERLLVMRTVVPIATHEDAPRATAFYRELLPELRVVPGVSAAAGVTSLPTSVRSSGSYVIEGRGSFDRGSVLRLPQAVLNVVTPEYFRTMRIPVKAGRDFSDADRMDAPFVAIINDALARTSFTGENPIGQRIQCGLDNLAFMTIVGVVGDVRTYGPARPAEPEIYMPYEQHPGPAASLTLLARTQSPDPLALSETLRRRIRERNPDVPVKTETMEMAMETATATPRFRTILLMVFAAVALALAVAGVYGVMAYVVSQRVTEIGVRVALGATPRDILRMILGQGAALAGAGLALGVAVALGAGRLLQGLLFGVTAHDPLVFAVVPIVVALAALGACYVPGRRALRVEPAAALRAE
jgi:putative ABC transport system permease protein